jgi:ABC-type glycerol-3-phosphate transport system permease component
MTLDIGWLASSLVFATFCAKRMLPLRGLAITSNLAFIGYGYLDALWPIVILHAAMLPVNVICFREAFLATSRAPKRRDDAATSPGAS